MSHEFRPCAALRRMCRDRDAGRMCRVTAADMFEVLAAPLADFIEVRRQMVMRNMRPGETPEQYRAERDDVARRHLAAGQALIDAIDAMDIADRHCNPDRYRDTQETP